MVMACDCISTIKDNFENVLVSITQHCPNLEIFIVEPLKSPFGPVADAHLEDFVHYIGTYY